MESHQTFILNQLMDNPALKLTELRLDIIKLLIASKKPLSAYEILNKLRKKRPNAEPPTVYRVIEYFLEKKIIHRIDTENKYLFCKQIYESKIHESNFHGLLFVCKKCLRSTETYNQNFMQLLKSLTTQQNFSMNQSVLEVTGVCKNCKQP